MRFILHIDMDAFYASIEQIDHPEYMGKPVIVGADPRNGKGRGVVAACSYEARKFGVRSALPITRAWSLCPDGVYVRPRMERYAEVSQQVMSVFRRYTDLVEPLSIDEAFLDITGSIALFGQPREIAASIKKEIRETTGLTASVGIAPNKFLAKIASDLKKPDGFVIVEEKNIESFLHDLPISRLWGVGPKTEQRLQREGLRTIGEIASSSRESLVRMLGGLGEHLYQLSRGNDDRPVVPNWEPKSISSETTFDEDTNDRELLLRTILELSDRIAERLRKEGYRAGKVTLKLRYASFSTHTKQHSLSNPAQDGTEIAREARALFGQFPLDERIRLIGVSAGDLHRDGDSAQLALFNAEDAASAGTDRRDKLGHTMDNIKSKFGAGSMRRGSDLLSLGLVVLFLALGACAKTRPLAVAPPPPPIPEDRIQNEQGLLSLHEFTPQGYLRAIDHFGRAAELQPDNCGYKLMYAESNLFLALEQKLNYEDFRPAWERAADPLCAPESAFALRLEVFRSLDDFGPVRDRTVLNKINQAILLEPNEPLNWFVRWKLNPTTNRQENAILKAAELNPDLALIQYEAGNYFLVKGEYPAAQSAFERALELSPGHFRSYIGLAQAISALDEQQDVTHLYRRAVELGPQFLEGRILLGDYYSGLEENELAREQYVAAVQQNPRYEVAHLRLGLSYLQSNSLDEAERGFNTAIEINPASYEAYYYRGNVWLARGNLEKAREQYEESLKYVLNFPDAVYALGSVLFRQGNMDMALEQFENLLRRNRNHADAYFSRAVIRSERRQYSDAIEDYTRALALYDRQLVAAMESIVEFEDRELLRKAEAEKRKKERLEGIMQRARQLKMRLEDQIMRGGL